MGAVFIGYFDYLVAKNPLGSEILKALFEIPASRKPPCANCRTEIHHAILNEREKQKKGYPKVSL